MKENTKNYVSRTLANKRKELLKELEIIDKGSVEGFKRTKEINIELDLLRDAIITFK